MTKKYKSPLKEAIHTSIEELHKIGLVDKETMDRFDKSCLLTIETYTPERIKAIRERENMSQAVFASYMNVRVGIVSEWERGLKKPSGPTSRLLSLVDHYGKIIIEKASHPS